MFDTLHTITYHSLSTPCKIQSPRYTCMLECKPSGPSMQRRHTPMAKLALSARGHGQSRHVTPLPYCGGLGSWTDIEAGQTFLEFQAHIFVPSSL